MQNNQSFEIEKSNYFLCHVAANEYEGLWTASKPTVIITAVINGLSAPVATIINILVLAVVLRTPSIRNPSTILLGCLVLTDFFVGFLVQPMTIFENIYRSHSCGVRVAGSLLEYTVTCVSFTTITAIAFEKYITLFHPLVCESYVTNRIALILSTLIWVFWLLLIPVRVYWSNTFFWSLLGVAWGCGSLTSVIIYAKIFRLLQHHKRRIRREQQTSDASPIAHTKSAITMGYIIGVLMVCYIPLGAVLLYQKNAGESKTALIAEAWSETLFYVTSSLNPIIYCCRNEEMRKAIAVQLKTMKTSYCCS